MNTITSKKSLVFWEQNQNKTNIYVNGGTDIKLFLKDNYINVFKKLRDELKDKDKTYTSFVKLWHKVCDDECDVVRKAVRTLIKHDYEDAEHDITRVVNKFRGNLGEIFVEAFFLANLASEICDGSTYVPVDPTNERFVDADVISNATGLPIGVQIKNFDKSFVESEVFNKALAEDAMRLRIDKTIPAEMVAEYLSAPHQIIFAFTDTMDMFIENNAAAVMFLGPKYIDSKKLQGDMAKKLPANWRFFDKIYNELLAVK